MSKSNDYFSITCRVICGESQGTGFLIKDDLVVTASHVITEYIDNGEKIYVIFEDDFKYEVYPENKTDLPITVLKLSEKRDEIIRPIGQNEITEDTPAKTYGYLSDSTIVESVSIIANRVLGCLNENEEYCNTVFTINASERIIDFSGFSGSPIVSNGYIIGILIRQVFQGGNVIRLKGICGVEFRKYLEQHNVHVPVSDCCNTFLQSTNNENVQLKTGELLRISEIDKVYNTLFEPIKKERLAGNIVESQVKLQEFLDGLPESIASNDKKAEFYFSGAVWMLLDNRIEESERYLSLAKENKSDLDDRVYHGYALLNQGRINEAKAVLLPLNTVNVLNTYIACLINENKDISEINAVIEVSGLKEDIHTYHLLAIAALKSDKFDEGRGYIENLYSLGVDNPELQILDALFYYWKAMKEYIGGSERMGFLSGPNVRFYPSKDQYENLEKAYGILSSVYSEELKKNNYILSLSAVWGLLIISTLLPEKDYMIWLDRFRQQERLHPLGILFCIYRGIDIPNDICEDFLAIDIPEKNCGLYAYTILCLLVKLEDYDKANTVFQQYKEKIAAYQLQSIEECEVNFLIQSRQFEKAKKKIKQSSLSFEIKERYEIGILDAEKTRSIKTFVSKAVNFAKTTKKSIDFHNADYICRKNNKWDFMKTNAKRWWETTNEIVALESIIEAWYELGYYSKCLKFIGLAENLGDCSQKIRYCKLNCFTAMSKYDEAIKVTETFENIHIDAGLVMARANIYIAEGKKDKAIKVLKDFADRDLYDLSVYKLLVNLLLVENRQLAFEYAYSLYLHDPKNPNVIRFTGMVGIMTGHDEISKEFFALIKEDEIAGENVRAVTLEEIKQMIVEGSKRLEKVNDMYLNLEIPIHLIANEHNEVLGGLLYANEISQGPRYARFGRRNIDKAIDLKTPILLDYSIFITLYSLNALEKVCDLFEEVWIPHHLFSVMLNDIVQLKNVQDHIVAREFELSDKLKQLDYSIHSNCHDEELDETFDRLDITNLNCAKKNNAFIIAESSNGKLWNKPVPDEWSSFYVDSNSFYAALDNYSLNHPEYREDNIDSKLVKKIIPHCNLIIDHYILSELIDNNSIEDVFTYFNVILLKETVDSIHLTASKHRNRIAAIDRLEKIYEILSHFKEEGKIKVTPLPDKDKKKEIFNPYVQLLYEELWFAENNECYLGIDDRFFGKFEGIKYKDRFNRIYSTYDILTCLEAEALIDKNTYYGYVDKLLSMKYCFFVPKADYLFSRLSLSKIHENGYLIEDRKMSLLRQMVGYAFDNKGGLGDKEKFNSKFSEFWEYMADTLYEFRKCLSLIWKSDNKLEQKRAYSDWLFSFWGDYITDISKEKELSEISLSQKQALLLLLSIDFYQNKGTMKQYIDWISQYFISFWYANPSQVDKVADCILVLFNNFLLSEDFKETEEYIHIMWIGFLLCLPERLLNKILLDPRGERYKEIIYYERWDCLRSSFDKYNPEHTIKINFEGILTADADSCEDAIRFVLSDPEKNIEEIINEFTDERIKQIENIGNYDVSRFLGNLVWYCPNNKQYIINEKKRLMVMYLDN